MKRALCGLMMIAFASMGIGFSVSFFALANPDRAYADGGPPCPCVEVDCYREVPCTGKAEEGMVRTYLCSQMKYCGGVPTYECCLQDCTEVEGCHYPN